MKIKNIFLSVALIMGSCSEAVLAMQPSTKPEQIKEAKSKLAKLKKAIKCAYSGKGCTRKERAKIIVAGVGILVATGVLAKSAHWWWMRQRGKKPELPAASGAAPGGAPDTSTPGGELAAAAAEPGPPGWKPPAPALDPTLETPSASQVSAVAARPEEGITQQEMELFRANLVGEERMKLLGVLRVPFLDGYAILRKNFEQRPKIERVTSLLGMAAYVLEMYSVKKMEEAAQVSNVRRSLPGGREYREEMLLEALDQAANFIAIARELPRAEMWRAGRRKAGRKRVQFQL